MQLPVCQSVGFTGIDDPYEVPQCPELKVDTHRLSVDEAVEHILAFMSTHQLLTTGKN
jgi:adenylylsulfate kinase